MRLESALFSSKEGITANGQAVAVVGDNISNANTTAFKTARAEFADLLSSAQGDRTADTVDGAGDGAQIKRVRVVLENGIIEPTGRDLDIGISGNGFFIVGDTTSQYYTRNGSFEINKDGFLAGPLGKTVLGYQGTSTTLSPIDMKQISAGGTPTTKAQLFGNLDSASEVTTVPTTVESFKDLNKNASYSNTQTVVDSLGQRHDMQLFFYKTAANEWTVKSYMDGSDVGGTAGVPQQIGTDIVLKFDGSGVISDANKGTAVITGTPAYSNGATSGNFTVDLSSFTQFGGNSLVNNVTQDGTLAGNVDKYEIDSDGKLYAVLDTGTRSQIGTIPLAIFNNTDGLERTGTSLYSPTEQTGDAKITTAGAGLVGTLESGALERSTVDIAEQFINLVLFQRGYQASSQVLNTASQMLKDTLSLA